jgi:cobaltochelatase CobN
MKLINIAAGARDSATIVPIVRSLKESGMNIDVHCADSEELDADERAFQEILRAAKEADMIVVRLHSDTSHFKKWDRFKEVAEAAKGLLFVDRHMDEVMREVRPLFAGTDEDYALLREYVELGGDENNRSLLLWAARFCDKVDVEVPPPIRQRTEGVYHPDWPRDIDLQTYLGTLDPDHPTIGIMFFQGYWSSDNIRPIDSLIRELEGMVRTSFLCSSSPPPSSVSGSSASARWWSNTSWKGRMPGWIV